MTDHWLGWHFLAEDRRLKYGDGRLVEAGQTYMTPDPERPLEVGDYGMHASKRALDALNNAAGPHISRVELTGERMDSSNISCGRSRHVLWVAGCGLRRISAQVY